MTVRDRITGDRFEVQLRWLPILEGPEPDALYSQDWLPELVRATPRERAALRRAGFDLAALERPGPLRARQRRRAHRPS